MLDFLRKTMCFLFDHQWVKTGHSKVACARCGSGGTLWPLVQAEAELERVRR